MILAKAVKKENLAILRARFDRILNSNESDYQKQIDLERLKTDMEFVFAIPLFTDSKFDEDHPDVMKLYREIKSKMV